MAKDTLICVEGLDAFKKYLHSRGIDYTEDTHKSKILRVHRKQTHTLNRLRCS